MASSSRYLVLLVWFGIVSAASVTVFVWGSDALIRFTVQLFPKIAFDDLSRSLLVTAVAALSWWKTVKVAVLLGIPLSAHERYYIQYRQKESKRPVEVRTVGGDADDNRDNRMWFAVILEAHPKSDRMDRYRMVMLLARLPFGIVLQIADKRVSVRKTTGHFMNDPMALLRTRLGGYEQA